VELAQHFHGLAHALHLPLRVDEFDCKVLALDVAEFAKALLESRCEGRVPAIL